MLSVLYEIPFYPLLLAIYPVLYLWSVNIFQASLEIILRPFLFSLILTAVLCSAAWLILRRLRKAAAVVGLFLILFFTYGHFLNLLQHLQGFSQLAQLQRYLLLAWVVIFIVFSTWIIRCRSDLRTLTWLSNMVAGFLVVLTVSQMGFVVLDGSHLLSQAPILLNPSENTASVDPRAGPNSPDVYYILLDGYDREDLLAQDIGLSNHALITQLEQLGFVVPSCTQSNYNTTVFSVASTFNMNYLDTLGFSYADLSKALYGVEFSTPELETAIRANPVMQQFKTMGYQVITFHEPFDFINFPNSDIIYDFSKGNPVQAVSSEFLYMFWRTTGLEFFIREAINDSFGELSSLPGWIQQMVKDNYNFHQKYQQDLYQLSKLDHITQVPGRKFVYAHLLVTHQAFAFKVNGEIRDDNQESKIAYGDQVTYVGQRILTIVKNILKSSKTPPIIILQGDHGYGIAGRGAEQFKILNAYYLPQDGGSAVYPNITPVNTFRLILSHYFNQDYPLLPDQSIWVNSGFQDGYLSVPGSCEP